MGKERIPTPQLLLATSITAMIAFCCQIVGVFGPAWVVTEISEPAMYIQNGVWYSRVCTRDTGTCMAVQVESLYRVITGKIVIITHSIWTNIQIMTTLALVLSLCSLVAMAFIQTKVAATIRRPLVWLSAGAAALSHSTMLVAAILVTTAAEEIESSWTEAWSRSVATASIPIGVISICLLLWVFSKMLNPKRRNRPCSASNNGIIFELPCVSTSEVFPLPPYTVNDNHPVAEPPPAYTEIELTSQQIRNV